jgi:hypothetical protein
VRELALYRHKLYIKKRNESLLSTAGATNEHKFARLQIKKKKATNEHKFARPQLVQWKIQ